MSSLKLDTGMVVLGQRSIQALREALNRDIAPQAATILQEVGYASGAQVWAVFEAWLHQDGVTDPGELDAGVLSEALSEFFTALGWGQMTLERVGNAGLAIDAPSWGEAQLGGGAQYPSCYLTAGLFSDFMARLSGQGVQVMETECRSRGDARCRFLVATPETIRKAYDAMVAGQDYTAAI
jgi:hypothetical protein